jgi:hypothetical protein
MEVDCHKDNEESSWIEFTPFEIWLSEYRSVFSEIALTGCKKRSKSRKKTPEN